MSRPPEALDEARGAICELAARLISTEVRGPLLHELASGPVPALLEDLEPGVRDEIERCIADRDAQRELDAEFCRLFILPGATAVPTRAVAWQAGPEVETPADESEFATRVAAWRAALGVEVATSGPWGRLVDDDLAVLLALHGHASATGELAIRDSIEHSVAPCLQRFAAALVERADSALYRALGRLLMQLFPTPVAPR